MIEYDENKFKIKLPKNLLESLQRNANGEIYFTVPVKQEQTFPWVLSSDKRAQNMNTKYKSTKP